MVNAERTNDVAAAVRDLTEGGAHVSVDALGIGSTCRNALKSPRKRGRQVQIGMTDAGEGANFAIPLDLIIDREIELLGSEGMPPLHYDAMLRMVAAGRLDPGRLVSRTVALEEASAMLAAMDAYDTLGFIVIDLY